MPSGSPARVFLFVLVSAFLVSCGGAHKPVDPGPRGTVRFKCEPKTAVLEVDETRLGPVKMFEKTGVLLRPGQHRVSLSAKDHFSEMKLIEVVEGKVTIVEINLREVPE